MSHSPQRRVAFAHSPEAALSARANGASTQGRGTWAMRDERRGEPLPTVLVLLDRAPNLGGTAVTDRSATLGAGPSHAAMVDPLQDVAGLEERATAAIGATGAPAPKAADRLPKRRARRRFRRATRLIPCLDKR